MQVKTMFKVLLTEDEEVVITLNSVVSLLNGTRCKRVVVLIYTRRSVEHWTRALTALG